MRSMKLRVPKVQGEKRLKAHTMRVCVWGVWWILPGGQQLAGWAAACLAQSKRTVIAGAC